MKDYIEIDYRDIAKMLASALPVEEEDFREVVETYLEIVKALPREARLALKCAYVFSRKVPRQEREDMFQDLAMAIYEAQTKDERLAYAIARCDWLNGTVKTIVWNYHRLNYEGKGGCSALSLQGSTSSEFPFLYW